MLVIGIPILLPAGSKEIDKLLLFINFLNAVYIKIPIGDSMFSIAQEIQSI